MSLQAKWLIDGTTITRKSDIVAPRKLIVTDMLPAILRKYPRQDDWLIELSRDR
jgi:hypothetical protein